MLWVKCLDTYMQIHVKTYLNTHCFEKLAKNVLIVPKVFAHSRWFGLYFQSELI